MNINRVSDQFPRELKHARAGQVYREAGPVKRTVTFNCEIPAAELLPPKFAAKPFRIQIRGMRCRSAECNFLDVFLDGGTVEVGGRGAAAGTSIKSGIESKSWRDGSRDGRNWPSSLSCAVDPRHPFGPSRGPTSR